MIMRFSALLILSLAFALTACGGPEVVLTTIHEPETPGGRLCAVQCRESHDHCLQRCTLKQRTCSQKMQTQAITDYENYTRQQYAAHAPVELRPRDFERPANCDASACHKDCGPPFQACYENCGGRIDTGTGCRFLCF